MPCHCLRDSKCPPPTVPTDLLAWAAWILPHSQLWEEMSILEKPPPPKDKAEITQALILFFSPSSLQSRIRNSKIFPSDTQLVESYTRKHSKEGKRETLQEEFSPIWFYLLSLYSSHSLKALPLIEGPIIVCL